MAEGAVGHPDPERTFGDRPSTQPVEDRLPGSGRRPGGGGAHRAVHARGSDAGFRLVADVLEAARGMRRAVTMPERKAIEIAISADVEDGRILRPQGKGGPAAVGARRGCAGDDLCRAPVSSSAARTTTSGWSILSRATRRS
jgi:hypothetical protein